MPVTLTASPVGFVNSTDSQVSRASVLPPSKDALSGGGQHSTPLGQHGSGRVIEVVVMLCVAEEHGVDPPHFLHR